MILVLFIKTLNLSQLIKKNNKLNEDNIIKKFEKLIQIKI